MKKIAFTLAEESHQFARIARKFGGNLNTLSNSMAFTLAEVLITLAIIGVVSALVIPSVLKNYNDKKYNTARLKALKTFGEAGKMASINEEMNSQTNAIDFVNNVLSKYLKITRVCTLEKSNDCNFPNEIQPSNLETTPKLKTVDLTTWSQIGSKNNTHYKISSPINDPLMSTVISVNDGFSALIHYNKKCSRNLSKTEMNFSVDQACMNIIYDMNGLKGPNHVGEDIGIVTVFWSGLSTKSVAPGVIPYSINYPFSYTTFANAPGVCAQKGTNKFLYSMPDINEISALYINNQLTSLPADTFWSSSPTTDSSKACRISVFNTYDCDYLSRYNLNIWCIRK